MADSDSDYSAGLGEGAPESYIIHDAAEVGDIQLLQQLLAALPAPSQIEGDAAVLAPVENPEVHIKDCFQCTPLHVAILNGQVECAELLIKSGASIKSDCDGCPPLIMATCLGAITASRATSLRLVQLLLTSGADVYSRDDTSRTALHRAAETGDVQVAAALLDAEPACYQLLLLQMEASTAAAAAAASADAAAPAVPSSAPQKPPTIFECQDHLGDLPLHVAARHGHAAVVQLLMERTPASIARNPVAAKNKAGQLPLHIAAHHGATPIAVALAQAAPATLSNHNRSGLTPSQVAAKRGHAALSDMLQSKATLAAAAAARSSDSTPAAVPSQTLVVAPDECLLHRTCPEPIVRGQPEPPPDNVLRLRVLTSPGSGILRSSEFAALQWQHSAADARLGDVMRIHDWPYVQGLISRCAAVPDHPGSIGHLDGDTAVSHRTFSAALQAAGAVCAAVRSIMSGQVRNAFCAVRPPGHHAGPRGIVASANDPHGSHGFCLLNNVAIGAAYAMNTYQHAGIQRVAILDFDVHHGNGTQACVLNCMPKTEQFSYSDAYSSGVHKYCSYKPWRDQDDDECIFFASVQGYGKKHPRVDAYVYPGSGGTFDNHLPTEAADGAAGGDAAAAGVEEDPQHEFDNTECEHPAAGKGPRVINVGIPGPGAHPAYWRRAWRDKVLPALVKFRPDFIFVSAGFDAHRKDSINYRYVGVREEDYEWLTDQLVQVANLCCNGRIVSVLEGGYNINGGIVSAFARSVAAHVRALAEPHSQAWDPQGAALERAQERKKREEKAARAAAAAAAAAAQLQQQGVGALGDQLVGMLPVGGSGELQDGVVEAAAAAGGGGEVGGGPVAKRRRTAPVDYAALNAQLEAEAKGGAGPGMEVR